MGSAIVYGIKIAMTVACALAFFGAVTTILGFLTSFVVPNILKEVIGLISIYLPFNAGTVFTGLSSIIVAILSFLVARKVYQWLGTIQRDA